MGIKKCPNVPIACKQDNCIKGIFVMGKDGAMPGNTVNYHKLQIALQLQKIIAVPSTGHGKRHLETY